MKTTNVIVISENGILQTPIVCNCDVRAGLIYADEARKLGVDLDEEEVQEMSFNDESLSSVINQVNNSLEFSGHDIKWFESTILKQLK